MYYFPLETPKRHVFMSILVVSIFFTKLSVILKSFRSYHKQKADLLVVRQFPSP